MSKIQVKLEDGRYADFTAYVVDKGNGEVKEFGLLEHAEAYLQELDQEKLVKFMKTHQCFVSYSNQIALIESFINWYANLCLFDKSEFLKLLQKVHKIDE